MRPWQLADGTEIDMDDLPAGQRVCYFCGHVHPEEHIHTGPVTKEDHWQPYRRGELECVGCWGHGPHPDMPLEAE